MQRHSMHFSKWVTLIGTQGGHIIYRRVPYGRQQEHGRSPHYCCYAQQTNSLQAAPLTISTSDAADTKGSKFLTGSIKAKGSDSARCEHLVAIAQSDCDSTA